MHVSAPRSKGRPRAQTHGLAVVFSSVRSWLAPLLTSCGRDCSTLVREINEKLGEHGWRPIVYLERHHDRREIRDLYRVGDFCMVTSLHDGMNLVAKEYIAARDDDDGVLVLSRFTGASRDLHDALLVNPYDIESMADAIRRAIELPADERRSRMRRMLANVREQNIYRWAAMLLADLARMPQSAPALRE